ncbi:hypothetical protein NY08_2393 [Rhodococcus sp. B7740]|nr:hypothetical protein NY08_2393 [Rhodococcus sp. B7740]
MVTVTLSLSVNQAKLLGEQHENTDAQRDERGQSRRARDFVTHYEFPCTTGGRSRSP